MTGKPLEVCRGCSNKHDACDAGGRIPRGRSDDDYLDWLELQMRALNKPGTVCRAADHYVLDQLFQVEKDEPALKRGLLGGVPGDGLEGLPGRPRGRWRLRHVDHWVGRRQGAVRGEAEPLRLPLHEGVRGLARHQPEHRRGRKEAPLCQRRARQPRHCASSCSQPVARRAGPGALRRGVRPGLLHRQPQGAARCEDVRARDWSPQEHRTSRPAARPQPLAASVAQIGQAAPASVAHPLGQGGGALPQGSDSGRGSRSVELLCFSKRAEPSGLWVSLSSAMRGGGGVDGEGQMAQGMEGRPVA